MSYRKGQHFSLKGIDSTQDSGVDYSKLTLVRLEELWRNTIENGMHGLCFSLYEDGQRPGDIITEEQVRRRMEIIKPYTKWVRSFSCTDGNEFIPKIAHEYGLKTLVGAWLGDDPGGGLNLLRVNRQNTHFGAQPVIRAAADGFHIGAHAEDLSADDRAGVPADRIDHVGH